MTVGNFCPDGSKSPDGSCPDTSCPAPNIVFNNACVPNPNPPASPSPPLCDDGITPVSFGCPFYYPPPEHCGADGLSTMINGVCTPPTPPPPPPTPPHSCGTIGGVEVFADANGNCPTPPDMCNGTTDQSGNCIPNGGGAGSGGTGCSQPLNAAGLCDDGCGAGTVRALVSDGSTTCVGYGGTGTGTNGTGTGSNGTGTGDCPVGQTKDVNGACVGNIGTGTNTGTGTGTGNCPIGQTKDVNGACVGNTGTGANTGTGTGTGTGNNIDLAPTNFILNGIKSLLGGDTSTPSSSPSPALSALPVLDTALTSDDMAGYVSLVNPFDGDNLDSFLPKFPDSICTHEIHSAFFGHQLDIAPCDRLQILRDILDWVFSIMTTVTIYKIAFKSNK
jgi:hypothetical protein